MELILIAGALTATFLILEFYDLVRESWPRQFTSTSHERSPIARSASQACDSQTIPVAP